MVNACIISCMERHVRNGQCLVITTGCALHWIHGYTWNSNLKRRSEWKRDILTGNMRNTEIIFTWNSFTSLFIDSRVSIASATNLCFFFFFNFWQKILYPNVLRTCDECLNLLLNTHTRRVIRITSNQFVDLNSFNFNVKTGEFVVYKFISLKSASQFKWYILNHNNLYDEKTVLKVFHVFTFFSAFVLTDEWFLLLLLVCDYEYATVGRRIWIIIHLQFQAWKVFNIWPNTIDRCHRWWLCDFTLCLCIVFLVEKKKWIWKCWRHFCCYSL